MSELEAVWASLRRHTQARIGLGRVGDALSTRDVLDYRTSHAVARDAIHHPLDVDALVAALRARDWAPRVVMSAAGDRASYLRRPDLGRRLAPGTVVPPAGEHDLALVVADGLSTSAVAQHAVPMLGALRAALDGRVTLAEPVVATQARVALGDAVARASGARGVLVLIGERPGLSVDDGLGLYLTLGTREGTTDAERHCVSNVRPPHGTGYAEAAAQVAALWRAALTAGRSGVGVGVGTDGPPSLPPSLDPRQS